ncbi:FAD-dependent oxidoreductase [Alphaproteobacteria bacterium]|nr:FAD-dependent oxidoreductase [Alphaproteobacteria bacterium]
MKQMNVLVVGAGPTGLTAAVELARRGVNVDVIDKQDTSSGWSRAVGIQPLSLELLRPSGVTNALLSEGIRFQSAKFYRKMELLATMPFALPNMDISFVLGLAQDRTEAHLREALEGYGGRVHYGVELETVKQDKGQVCVTLAKSPQGLATSFDFLIGADGVRSRVREQVGILFPGFDLPGKWSIADVNADYWAHPDAFTICQLDGGNVAVVAPMEVNRFRVVASTPDALSALPLRMDVTSIRRAGDFSISIRVADSYQKGRVFLAGDAAHCHSPAGGRGMNLGIADAVELARRLVEGSADGYSDHRHKIGKIIVGKSEQARKVLTATNPLIRLGTYGVMKLVDRSPFLQRRVAMQALFD